MSDAALLQEIREHRSLSETVWDPIRAEARKDRLCIAGRVWEAVDPDGKKERDEAKRPVIELDELGQYINQTINGVRANPRGIKFSPTGNGANDKGAEFYQNHMREIEYRSQAPQVGYPTPFDHAVTSSYGWLQVKTEREHIRTFDHNMRIEAIVNPDQILPDPYAVWPDSRDLKFLYQLEPWTRQEFTAKYPKAKASSKSSDWRGVASKWVDDKRVVLANYWRLETFERTLVAYRDPDGNEQAALIDELPDKKLPDGVENLREDTVEDSRVVKYFTNGLELLGAKVDWPGRYIPFVSCFGKILYVDDGVGAQRQLISMTRLARSPAMLYCYLASCVAEAVGEVPRSSWIGYEGQFAKPERWAKANRKPVPFLESKITVAGTPPGTLLPLPVKLPWDPPLQNLEISKEAARRAIQAAMGITPLPTVAQRQNEKSGKALMQIEASGQRGSFHFVDHYDLMIERAGIICEDLMTPILDTARTVPARKADDSAILVRINDAKGSEIGADGAVSGDPIFTKGDYRVTVSTGPATDSQRDAAENFVDAIVGNIGMIAQMTSPLVAAKVFAKSVKLKQLGPIGDEIIGLLDPMQKGQDGKPLPPEMAKLLAENQQLKQILQRASQEKQAKVVEQQGKFAIVQFQEEAATERADKDREAKLAVAALSAKFETFQSGMTLLADEIARIGSQQHEASETMLQRLHEAVQGTQDRAHQAQQTDVTAEHAAAQSVADAEAAAAAATNGAGA